MLEGAERESTARSAISDGAGIGTGDGNHLICGGGGAPQGVVAGGAYKAFDPAEAVRPLSGAATGLGGVRTDRDIDIAAAGIAQRVGTCAAINGVAAGVGAGDGLVVVACRDVEFRR